MCGIFGSLGNKAIDEVYVGLKRLEYRGYDSFGFAALHDKSVEVVRQTGPLDKNVFWELPSTCKIRLGCQFTLKALEKMNTQEMRELKNEGS